MKKICMLISFLLIISTTVSQAKDNIEFISTIGVFAWGVPKHILSSKPMDIDNIEEEVRTCEDLELVYRENGKLIIQSGDNKYELDEYHFGPDIDDSLYDKMTDKKWLQGIIYQHLGVNDNVHSVMYKPNKFKYETIGNLLDNEIWMFGENNVYIAEVYVDPYKYMDKMDVTVNNVYDYNDWYARKEFKPQGKCVYDGKEIATCVYANEEESYIPLRAVVEAIGGTIEWDEETYTSTIRYNNAEYICTYEPSITDGYGALTLSKDDRGIALDRMSVGGGYCIDDGTTYLPSFTASNLFRALDISLTYKADEKTVYVKKRD